MDRVNRTGKNEGRLLSGTASALFGLLSVVSCSDPLHGGRPGTGGSAGGGSLLGAGGLVGTGGAFALGGSRGTGGSGGVTSLTAGNTGTLGTGGGPAGGGSLGAGGYTVTGDGTGTAGKGGVAGSDGPVIAGASGKGGVEGNSGAGGESTTGTAGMSSGGAGGIGGATGTGGTSGSGGTLDASVDAPTGGDGGASGGGGSGEAGGTVSGTPGPSCAGMPANCGPYQNEDCCISFQVPGGTFYRSYDGITYTSMGYPATVSAFTLDKYEVTVGRFRAFVSAGMGTQASPPTSGVGEHPLISGTGWDPTWNSNLVTDTEALKTSLQCSLATWTDNPGVNENLPIDCVDWFEAFAFCAWDGGRLATEAEWNYAAAGGNEQREYPWGARAPDSSLALFNCYGDGSSACVLTDYLPVGSKPAGNGRWGHADLAGSLFEWVLDAGGSYDDPCVDCANTSSNSSRVLRGGGVNSPDWELQSAFRIPIDAPDLLNAVVGFRCARTNNP
jgi:formylglycine-generating enzyme required for sulfatase activity